MKILVTGKNGQVGFELQRALAPLGEIVAVGQAECDLANADVIRELVRQVAPDVIVNPAAYTAVDKAESDHATASQSTRKLPACWAKKLRASVRWSCIIRPITFLTAPKKAPIPRPTCRVLKAFTATPSLPANLPWPRQILAT